MLLRPMVRFAGIWDGWRVFSFDGGFRGGFEGGDDFVRDRVLGWWIKRVGFEVMQDVCFTGKERNSLGSTWREGDLWGHVCIYFFRWHLRSYAYASFQTPSTHPTETMKPRADLTTHSYPRP